MKHTNFYAIAVALLLVACGASDKKVVNPGGNPPPKPTKSLEEEAKQNALNQAAVEAAQARANELAKQTNAVNTEILLTQASLINKPASSERSAELQKLEDLQAQKAAMLAEYQKELAETERLEKIALAQAEAARIEREALMVAQLKLAEKQKEIQALQNGEQPKAIPAKTEKKAPVAKVVPPKAAVQPARAPKKAAPAKVAAEALPAEKIDDSHAIPTLIGEGEEYAGQSLEQRPTTKPAAPQTSAASDLVQTQIAATTRDNFTTKNLPPLEELPSNNTDDESYAEKLGSFSPFPICKALYLRDEVFFGIIGFADGEMVLTCRDNMGEEYTVLAKNIGLQFGIGFKNLEEEGEFELYGIGFDGKEPFGVYAMAKATVGGEGWGGSGAAGIHVRPWAIGPIISHGRIIKGGGGAIVVELGAWMPMDGGGEGAERLKKRGWVQMDDKSKLMTVQKLKAMQAESKARAKAQLSEAQSRETN